MTPQDYAARRAKLVSEFNFLKQRRMYLSARKRVQMIAALDYDYDKIPKEKTLRIFNYDDLKND